MNNFELDRRAKELAASNSGYNLARRFLILEDQLAEARREAEHSHKFRGKAVVYRWIGVPCGEPVYCEEIPGEVDYRNWEPLYRHSPAPAAVPESFWTLDADEVALLHEMTQSDSEVDAPEIELFYGKAQDDDGNKEHGLLLRYVDCPEEGVIPICTRPGEMPSAPATADPQ